MFSRSNANTRPMDTPRAWHGGILGTHSSHGGRAAVAEYDAATVWTTMSLLIMGLVMVYSASIATAEASRFTGFQPTYYLVRHALFLAFSLTAAMLAFQVPMRAWQQMAPWLFVAGGVLLVLVLIPHVGREVNGAKRWISLSVITLQPSEFMKLAAVIYAADYTVRKSALMHSFKKGLLPMLSVMLVVGWLLLREPDFGAFVVITCIAMGILFLGGMNARWFAGLIVTDGLLSAVGVDAGRHPRDCPDLYPRRPARLHSPVGRWVAMGALHHLYHPAVARWAGAGVSAGGRFLGGQSIDYGFGR